MKAKRFNIQAIFHFLDAQSVLLRYGLAVLTVALAMLVTQHIPVIGQRAAYLLFFFAINQIAFWLGLYPGFIGMALSLIAVNRFVLFPAWHSESYGMLILNLDFFVVASFIIATTAFGRHLLISLWESQQDLNHAQVIGHIGNWRLDVRRNRLHWSNENHFIFGIPEKTPMTYETFLSIVHPEDREYVDQKWQAALLGKPYDIEHRIIVDGKVKWLRERAELEFSKNEILLGGFGTTQDITERKLIELELRESRRRYAGIIESAMDAVITVDVNQCILVFNAAAEKMFGCKADQVLGGSLERFIPERFRDAHAIHIRAFGQTRITNRKMSSLGTITGIRWNGQEFPIEVSISQSGQGAEKIFTAILRDITERLRGEVALENQLKLQDQLVKVAASVPGLICSFRLNPDGTSHMPYASSGIESVLGFSADTLSNDFSPVFASIHPEDIGHVNDTTTESARTLQPWHGSFRYHHPGKGEIWLESHSMPQRESDGSILWHGYIQDITASKLAEAAIVDKENELRLIMDATPALIAYLDTDFRYLRANKSYENWFCLPLDLIIGHDVREIIGEKAWHIVHPLLERARSGERVSLDYQIPYGTGKPRWVQGNYIPDKNSVGFVRGIVVHVVDIEDRKQAELERQKFVSLADNSEEFIGMCDMNFNPFYVNAAGMRLVGLNSLEQALQTPVKEFFFPEDRQFIIEEFFPRVLREQKDEVEIRFRHFKTGVALWMLYNVFYIKNDNDETVGLATVSRDITKRKQAEAMVRESEERMRLATEATGVGIWEWNVITNQIRWDAQMFRTYGIAPTQNGFIEYKTWSNSVVPEDLPYHEQKLQEIAHRGGRSFREFRILRAGDNEIRYIYAVETVRTKESGDIEWVVGTNLDITDRVLADNALSESKARLDLVIEEVKAGYWDWDLNTNMLYLSPEWNRQLGLNITKLHIQWNQKYDRLHPDDRTRVVAAIQDFIAERTPVYETEFRMRHRDGSYRWIHSRGALLRNVDHQPIRMLGINLDITDYKRTNELNQRREQMEQSFRFQVASQTAAAIAHELNQPLNAISSYAEVALQLLHSGNPNPPKLNRVMESCVQQAQRAGQVIRQLLALLHKGEMNSEPIDINHSVNDAVDFVRNDSQFRSFTLKLDLAADLPPVAANGLQIQKVLINLLHNSLESMQESGKNYGTIRVTTCRAFNQPAFAQLTVCDSGKGVPDIATLSKLFHPFYTTKATGLGMGLAICRSLIETYGGKMWAEQNAGNGISVHFTLPFVL